MVILDRSDLDRSDWSGILVVLENCSIEQRLRHRIENQEVRSSPVTRAYPVAFRMFPISLENESWADVGSRSVAMYFVG